jgi:uncharacterized protein RhaS with RHS repeats
MKKIQLFVIALGICQMIQAQNPFEEFGYKGKILTATNGRFNEFHDLDSVVQIGSVLLDVHKLVIVGDAPIDTITYMPSPTVISRWLSPDPLSEKYFSFSPYNYVLNNPIVFTDPDGRDVNLGNLYDKDDKGKYKYSAQILAFELFAKTKSGQQFLKERAQKGFEFKAAFIKSASFTAKEGGALSGKIDANFKVTNLDTYEGREGKVGADGLTEAEIKDDGKLSVTYHMDEGRSELKEPLSESGYDILNKTDTYFHEVFIHGAAKEQNFMNGKYKNVGPIPPGGNAEHTREFVQKSPYYQISYPALKSYNSALKLNYTDEKIWRTFIFHGN